MKLNYFTQAAADTDDTLLVKAKLNGHVPVDCLLGGRVVYAMVAMHHDPCTNCAGPRDRCKGRPEAPPGNREQHDQQRHLYNLLAGDKPDGDPLQELINK